MIEVDNFDTIMTRNNTTALFAKRADRENAALSTAAAAFRVPAANARAMVVAACVIMCLCMLSTAGAASIQKRMASISSSSPAEDTTTAPVKTCHQNTPCGWAIYIPFSRRIDYFMKNTCECGNGFACLKTDDDLSVNAYVYRCKTRPATTTTDNIDMLPTSI